MARTRKNASSNGNGKTFATQQSLDSAVWSICNILRRSNCAGALQYVPELTWILFLRILDERETQEAEHCKAVGAPFTPSLQPPYRWQDWAAPGGNKRVELQGTTAIGTFFSFVNGDLIPHLKQLRDQPDVTPRQRVISEIMSGVERTRVDTERNFLDVLDKVHEISAANVDDTHIFPLSQVYEGLLLKMGEKGNDGGQFFTPREIIRAMVRVIDPRIGAAVYDPCCGTGGFLAQSYEYMVRQAGDSLGPEQSETLKQHTFYGREKENLIYPVALANLVLHGIDQPNIWHGNTLTGGETYGGLFQNVPAQFDVVLTNPPFGGKEGKEARTSFAYKTGATQVLFLQHVMDKLAPGGRCGIVLDEGVLFRTNETAFVQVKRKLLNEFNVWCIISLPGGVFSAAGAGVKANLLFFTKGEPTERIWYYDLSDIKVGKKNPFTVKALEEFWKLLPDRADSEHSWTMDIAERRAAAKREADPLRAQAARPAAQAAELQRQIKVLDKTADADRLATLKAQAKQYEAEARELNARAEAIENAVYDLKAVNPHAKSNVDTRTPEELLYIIEAKSREVHEALAIFRVKPDGVQ